MSEVRKWLELIGLSQYADAFETNDLDIDLLRQVDDQLLKDIGVASAGHRLRIRNAIAKLEAKVPSETADGLLTAPRPAERQQPVSTLPPATPLSMSAEIERKGERRYLTVMFCDLVGSTSISAHLDAEEWRDLVGAYLDVASTAVTEMGGYVAKKLGDGLMALFGFPVAQENDAERAARAALSIQRGAVEVNRKNAVSGKPPLNARIGIETGSVVVDAAGEIYGDAPNIAALCRPWQNPVRSSRPRCAASRLSSRSLSRMPSCTLKATRLLTQGGARSSTNVDRAGGTSRGASGRPALALFRSIRCLGGEPCNVQRRGHSRAGRAFPGACG